MYFEAQMRRKYAKNVAETGQGWAVETTPVLTSGYRPGQYAKKWSILVNTNLSGRLKILRDLFVVD